MPQCPNCLENLTINPIIAGCPSCFYPTFIPRQINNSIALLHQTTSGYGMPYSAYAPPPHGTVHHGGYGMTASQPVPVYTPTIVEKTTFNTCSHCGGSDPMGKQHVCFPDLPSPLRLSNIEINTLKAEHNSYIVRYQNDRYHKTMSRVQQARDKVAELQAELLLRQKIKNEALSNAGAFANFPLPTDLDIFGARYLTYALQLLARLIPLPNIPHLSTLTQLRPVPSMTLAVGSSGEKLYYALSGESKSTGGKLGKYLPELEKLAGSVFVGSFASNLQYEMEQGFSKSASYDRDGFKIRVCAEPKLWGIGSPGRYYGLCTVWVGTDPNPFPLISNETSFGSPMLPCTRCCAWAKGKKLK